MTFLDVSGYQEPSRNRDYYSVVDFLSRAAPPRPNYYDFFTDSVMPLIPKEKPVNIIEIPVKNIKNIVYRNDTKLGDDQTMSIEMQPYGAYSFTTDEWVTKESVKKDYLKKDEAWTKDGVVEMLRDRALKLRIASGNHGAKQRYGEANRMGIAANELELVANALQNTGKMPYGIL